MTRFNQVALGLAALSLTTGCGLGAESSPRVLDRNARPFQAVVTTASPAPTGTGRAIIYLARNQQLVAVVRRVPLPPSPEDVLAALEAGPNPREQDAGVTTAVPLKAKVDERSQVPGTLVVEVPAPDNVANRTDEVLGYAQIVVTLSALTDVSGVRFVRNGRAIAVPRGDGSLSQEALTRRDYAEVF